MSTPPPPARPSVPPPGLPREGEIIAGKYRVERLLGAGGMGAVLAARHLELDDRVAIKLLLPHLPVTGEPALRFIREAKAAIKIKNEHVVRVLDVGRTETAAPYIVMEYLDGSDLGRVLERDGPLSVENALLYVTQACEAIAAAHAVGIIHRDLKPANLFLATASDGSPCVKVLDFGISKLSDSHTGGSPGLTSTATIMGTPCFMSPEQLRSTRDVDARADIWSIGAIIHALLTGAPPYDGESNADVSAKIIRDAPTPIRQLRPDAPPELEAIVLRCLAKEPDQRFADVVELAEALATITPLPATKASAARVARIAAAVAPTVLSVPPPAEAPRLALPSSDPGPTKTASAWGDTRREEKRNRRLAGIVAACGVTAGLVLFGILRLTTGSSPAPAAAPPAAAIVLPSAAASAVPAPPGASLAGAVAPAPSASSTPVTSLPVAPTPSARASGRVPPHSASSTVATPPPASTKTGAGLFDGRE